MRRALFKLKIFFHSIYLSILLRKRVKVNWRVVDLVLEKNGYCPCRFGKTRENKCPCKWYKKELIEKKRCRCGLFYL